MVVVVVVVSVSVHPTYKFVFCSRSVFDSSILGIICHLLMYMMFRLTMLDDYTVMLT